LDDAVDEQRRTAAILADARVLQDLPATPAATIRATDEEEAPDEQRPREKAEPHAWHCEEHQHHRQANQHHNEPDGWHCQMVPPLMVPISLVLGLRICLVGTLQRRQIREQIGQITERARI
jgi:hypothetical protein